MGQIARQLSPIFSTYPCVPYFHLKSFQEGSVGLGDGKSARQGSHPSQSLLLFQSAPFFNKQCGVKLVSQSGSVRCDYDDDLSRNHYLHLLGVVEPLYELVTQLEDFEEVLFAAAQDGGAPLNRSLILRQVVRDRLWSVAEGLLRSLCHLRLSLHVSLALANESAGALRWVNLRTLTIWRCEVIDDQFLVLEAHSWHFQLLSFLLVLTDLNIAHFDSEPQ